MILSKTCPELKVEFLRFRCRSREGSARDSALHQGSVLTS